MSVDFHNFAAELLHNDMTSYYKACRYEVVARVWENKRSFVDYISLIDLCSLFND